MKDGYTDKERDAFWDISRLVPQKRSVPPRSPIGGVPLPTVEGIPSATANAVPTAESRQITQKRPLSDDVTETTYVPADNPLIRLVTVKRSVGGYSFYAQFLRDAERYFDTPGTPCEYAPYFSFTPQYNQLSPAQLSYYFYLRSEVRAGRYPRADKGYFFLLVYEIIHLEDRIPPEEGSRLLAALWGAYRTELDGIDRYMIPWLSDYCLLHGVPCPPDLADGCLAVAGECDGTEFYFGAAAEATPLGVRRLLALSSDYRFEASRAATEETRPLFARHITGAMERVFRYLLSTGVLALSDRPERFSRRAFSGSLCSHNVRAELSVEYVSLRRSEGWRRTVTLAVKYAENCVRAALGIRARLSVSALSPDVRTVIDGYFAAVRSTLPRRGPEPPPAPAYERLYDAPDRGLDTARAADIEAASWALTRRLVEDGEAAPLTPPALAPTTPSATVPVPPSDVPSALAPLGAPVPEARTTPIPTAPSMVASTPTASLVAAATSATPADTAVARGVAAYLEGGVTPTAVARALGLPEALLADKINEAFLVDYGDVLLEPSSDGYQLIEDYRKEAEEWLKTLRK